jgi:hypothetical protein
MQLFDHMSDAERSTPRVPGCLIEIPHPHLPPMQQLGEGKCLLSTGDGDSCPKPSVITFCCILSFSTCPVENNYAFSEVSYLQLDLR